MSIYCEEVMEALTEALQKKDFPNVHIMALNALLYLPGRLNASGKYCTEAWLLKTAGFEQPYSSIIQAEKPCKTENQWAETVVCINFLFVRFFFIFWQDTLER